MANLKAVVRKQRVDGIYPVYIRIVHRRKMGYIKTNKLIAPEKIAKNGDLKDSVVNEYCARLIREYTDKLNRHDISQMTVAEVIEMLNTSENGDVCFSDYADLHIHRMKKRGQVRNAKNYELAKKNLELYVGSNRIMFSALSSTVLNKWIASLGKTSRAKEMYPVCIRQIFKAALLELNDEERGICRIKFNPWLKVQIPKADKAVQRAISAEECREFFCRPLPQTKMLSSLPELGRDVAMLVLCLGGINTVDLFEMKKSNYQRGCLCYNRAKTKKSRSDDAYIEMRVEPFIRPVFEKYLAGESSEYLFNFHERYCDSDSFSANVNNGIKKICKDMGMAKEDYYCVYTFRHTWGTIAQNDCEANLYEVAFGMNHSHGLKVTRGYVKIDFSPAWKLNAKVIDFVFYSDAPSKQGIARDIEESEDKLFRISKKSMIWACAYYKGKPMATISDIGFGTVAAVIKALAKELPSDLPTGAVVQFRIKNADKGTEIVYEHTKGKGF